LADYEDDEDQDEDVLNDPIYQVDLQVISFSTQLRSYFMSRETVRNYSSDYSVA